MAKIMLQKLLKLFKCMAKSASEISETILRYG